MYFDPTMGGNVITGQDGRLIIEAETATIKGNWSKVTIDGERSVLWDGDRSNYRNVEESETLSYTFRVDESGLYSIGMHSARLKSVMNASDRFENGSNGAERTDTGNDAYVAIKDAVTGQTVKSATKLFTGLGSTDQELRWGTKFDDSSGHYDAQVQLQAGRIYELEIVGRSDGYVLDRVTFNKGNALKDSTSDASPVVQVPAEGNTPLPTDEPADPIDPDGGSGSESSGDFFESIASIFESIFDAIASIFGGGKDEPVSTTSAQLTALNGAPLLSDMVPSVAITEDASDVVAEIEDDNGELAIL